ncbi:MAG: fumarate hydratase [Dehalococcoidia bacterium]|nr:MAG: fumarate hydratase [Dehalococcoidia bacterium]
MGTRTLATPLSETDVRGLAVSDEVYLNGPIYTCRSLFQIRAIEQDILPPLDFGRLNVMLHMGGIISPMEGGWSVTSMLATSSYRFDKLTPPIIEKLGVRAIIGKGTMGRNTMTAMKQAGCVHLSWGSVMGNVLARRVKKVVEVHGLEELGPVEATWVLQVENFGPLVVDIDTHGNNLFYDVASRVEQRLNLIYDRYGIADFVYTSDEFEASNPEHADRVSGQSDGHA